jgi:hypothetical protein
MENCKKLNSLNFSWWGIFLDIFCASISNIFFRFLVIETVHFGSGIGGMQSTIEGFWKVEWDGRLTRKFLQ